MDLTGRPRRAQEARRGVRGHLHGHLRLRRHSRGAAPARRHGGGAPIDMALLDTQVERARQPGHELSRSAARRAHGQRPSNIDAQSGLSGRGRATSSCGRRQRFPVRPPRFVLARRNWPATRASSAWRPRPQPRDPGADADRAHGALSPRSFLARWRRRACRRGPINDLPTSSADSQCRHAPSGGLWRCRARARKRAAVRYANSHGRSSRLLGPASAGSASTTGRTSMNPPGRDGYIFQLG
jgi:hypothetical protein